MSQIAHVRDPASSLALNNSGASTDAQLIGLWLRGKRSKNTRAAYENDIKRFRAFCQRLPAEPEGDLPASPMGLRDVSVSHVQLYLETLSNEGAAPASVARRLSTLKSLLSFAQKVGYVAFNTGSVVQGPVVHNFAADRILTEAQVAGMIRAVGGRDAVLIRLLYLSGARVSEVVSLKWSDVQEREDRVNLRLVGKGNKERIVPLPLSTKARLDSLRRPGVEWVFAGYKGGHISRHSASRIVKRAARIAGCPDASPHCLRHSHASHAIRHGAPLHVVQQSLGHSSLATLRYLHLEKGESSAMYLEKK